MMPDFRRVRGLFLREYARVMVVMLRLEICMWFGPVNDETYVHGYDRARYYVSEIDPATEMIQQAWNSRRSAGADSLD